MKGGMLLLASIRLHFISFHFPDSALFNDLRPIRPDFLPDALNITPQDSPFSPAGGPTVLILCN